MDTQNVLNRLVLSAFYLSLTFNAGCIDRKAPSQWNQDAVVDTEVDWNTSSGRDLLDQNIPDKFICTIEKCDYNNATGRASCSKGGYVNECCP